MPELLLMLAPNVNSFKRLVPGIFAPIAAFWGVENRSCALRVIPGTPGLDPRRVPDAGRRREPVLRDRRPGRRGPVRRSSTGSSRSRPCSATRTRPRCRSGSRSRRAFRDGIDRFRASAVARELFGDTFVDHYADTREWQEREFRGLVTDRELERFFELA